jgi:RNA polymerase sigma factor (sigma-70 family)
MSPQLLSGAARLAGSSLLRLQSDERLVALVRDGHDPAFTAIVDRYGADLVRYSTRIVGEARAEDIVQQAFLNAHTALMSSENDIQLRPWLYRIAHNAGLNVLRSSRDQVELDERLAATGTVEQTVETNERLTEALAAIARLPEPQRDALTLRALEGRSHQEIAEAIGVTPGAARQHLHRARASVRTAVTALTPYGLLARFAMAGGSDPVATGALVGAGAGIGATVTKVGAGVLAAGAIATGTTGHLPFTADRERPTPAAAQPVPAAAAGGDASAVADPLAAHGSQLTRVVAVSTGGGQGSGRTGAGDDHGRGNGDDRNDHGGSLGSGRGDESHRRRSGDDDNDDSSGSGSGDDDRESSGSGSGDDDHKTSSGSSGSGSSDDDEDKPAGSSGSGSSDDDEDKPAGSSGSGSSDDDEDKPSESSDSGKADDVEPAEDRSSSSKDAVRAPEAPAPSSDDGLPVAPDEEDD